MITLTKKNDIGRHIIKIMTNSAFLYIGFNVKCHTFVFSGNQKNSVKILGEEKNRDAP